MFVIETKNYRGWIFGSEGQKQWTQTIYKKKSKFQNPLHQNRLHIRALEEFLALEPAAFHSVILFIGDAQLKTALPPNVLTQGLGGYIRTHQEPVLAPEVAAKCNQSLDQLSQSTNRRAAARQHLAALRAKS